MRLFLLSKVVLDDDLLELIERDVLIVQEIQKECAQLNQVVVVLHHLPHGQIRKYNFGDQTNSENTAKYLPVTNAHRSLPSVQERAPSKYTRSPLLVFGGSAEPSFSILLRLNRIKRVGEV